MHFNLDFFFILSVLTELQPFQLITSITACVPALSAVFLKRYMFSCSDMKMCLCILIFGSINSPWIIVVLALSFSILKGCILVSS